jgi:TldD protein
MPSFHALKGLLSDLVRELEHTVPYASALALEEGGERIQVQTREERAEPIDPRRGIVISVFTGRCFLEAATNDLDPSALKQVAEKLLARAREEGIFYDGPKIDPGPETKEDFTVPCEIPPESIPLTQKLELGRKIKALLHDLDFRVVQAVAQILFIRKKELFVNRSKILYQHIPRVQSLAFLVMRENGRSAELHAGQACQGGFEKAALEEKKIRTMVLDCARILKAGRFSPGLFDCIFSPEFAGIFAHEAFGHGTETDMFLKRRARGAQYLDKPVASPLVDLYDSPALPGQAASFFFDHEGEMAKPTKIIERGILKSGLTDLNSALRLKLARTANGRRESYRRKAYARMTNTYFGPGENTLEEMVASIPFGYLLSYPSNGMEDPKGWGIQLEGYLAEEIREGRLTGRVYSPVIVTGYVPDLLMSISMVGKEVEIAGLGMCGKGHKEWVKVTDGGPYLKLKARLS